MNYKQATAYLEKNSLTLFYLLLADAVLLRFLDDLFLGRWRIHGGEIFPYRHPGYFPLYGQSGLLLEWALTLTGAILLLTRERRKGALIAAVGITLSLSQMLQNQKILLWIILWVVALCNLEGNIFSRKFLKWQLVLVYLFTGLAKIFDQFITGKTLNLIAQHQITVSIGVQKSLWVAIAHPAVSQILSLMVVAVEFAIPILFFKKKEWAWPVVLLLHGGFLFLMRDLTSFSFSMFALAVLFYGAEVTSNEEDLTQPVSEPG